MIYSTLAAGFSKLEAVVFIIIVAAFIFVATVVPILAIRWSVIWRRLKPYAQSQDISDQHTREKVNIQCVKTSFLLASNSRFKLHLLEFSKNLHLAPRFPLSLFSSQVVIPLEDFSHTEVRGKDQFELNGLTFVFQSETTKKILTSLARKEHY